MFGIPFSVLAAMLAVFFVGVEIDVGHSFTQYVQMQTGAEASTLAGATAQKEYVTHNQSGTNAPVQYGYYIKQDGTAQQRATEAWNKNVGQWGSGPWENATPTWTLTRRDTAKTPQGQDDTVQATVSGTIDMGMSNKNFSMDANIPIQTTVASSVHETIQANTVSNTISQTIK